MKDMSIFDKPAYIKPSDPKGDVFVFGKGPELEGADARNGVARVGGLWRRPDYFRAYLRSAAVLIEHGVRHEELDEVMLPAFYLQRHALELLIKRLLSYLYEWAEFRVKLGYNWEGVPSNGQKDRFTTHGIHKLFQDLCRTCKHFKFTNPPLELAALVKKLTQFEKTETWSRYAQSKNHKDDTIIQHLEDEVEVPIVDLQRDLEFVASKITYRFDGEPAYENELYDHWADAARAVGHIG